jgi:hypothetical protein
VEAAPPGTLLCLLNMRPSPCASSFRRSAVHDLTVAVLAVTSSSPCSTKSSKTCVSCCGSTASFQTSTQQRITRPSCELTMQAMLVFPDHAAEHTRFAWSCLRLAAPGNSPSC